MGVSQAYDAFVLRLYRRHRRSCRQRSERYRRCACPIYVEGTLRGESVKKSLDLTSWTAASDLIAKWNESGEIGGVKPEIPTIVEAVEKFLADARARHIGWETARKYENLLHRRFLAWCDAKGYRLLKQVGVDQLREFRASWTDGVNYAAKNLERLRAFFRFCEQAEWVRRNPALAVKAPKCRLKPALPFSPDEMTRILEACDRYPGNRDRIKAFVLVMRYAGLRMFWRPRECRAVQHLSVAAIPRTAVLSHHSATFQVRGWLRGPVSVEDMGTSALPLWLLFA